ncbi:substrate-binding periplasmic protein [Dongshaea marina]|uniref:substrate-binding periplasmic protein n=1 Tax=Dongshaea marina TaxID=2047966 RepID=UPI000D3EB553|nr:transporter substrate-binding domain-containing protein [Dongshaea marina]
MNRVNIYAAALTIVATAFISNARAELSFVTQDFAPFSYGDKGTVLGPFSESIEATCAKLNSVCPIFLKSWLRAQWEVDNGRIDGLFPIGWNKGRSETLYFSPPILRTEYGIFVRSDNPLNFKKESDIKGYRVGVYGPSNTEKSLLKIKRNIKELAVSVTNDDERQFKKLSRGKIQAVYSNKDVGFYLIKKLGLDNIRYAGTHKSLMYYIGFSKKYNSPEMVVKFNTALLSLYKSGELHKILSKYNMRPIDDMPSFYPGPELWDPKSTGAELR